MTRTYTYTFKHPTKTANGWTVEEKTLTKRVTDKMEERNAHKAGYAARYFNDVLRAEYGYHTSPVTAARVTEITKGA